MEYLDFLRLQLEGALIHTILETQSKLSMNLNEVIRQDEKGQLQS
jgi:hypothetical protein